MSAAGDAAGETHRLHTLASIVKKLRMPFSTVCRVIWPLTEEAGDIRIIRYPADRRKKLLVINERNERSENPRAIARAMFAY